MRKKIPKHIVDKIKRIEHHQSEVKRLVDLVEEYFEIQDVVDDESAWSWGMYVDQQGAYYTAADNIQSLKEFIERRDDEE